MELDIVLSLPLDRYLLGEGTIYYVLIVAGPFQKDALASNRINHIIQTYIVLSLYVEGGGNCHIAAPPSQSELSFCINLTSTQ